MDSLYFNKKEFEELEEVPFLATHVESNLYFFEDLIIKKYIWDNNNRYEKFLRENKVEALNNININGLIFPNYKVYIEGVFEGISLPFLKDGITFSYMKNKSLKRKIMLYKEASSIMKEAHKKGIVLCDVAPNNILYNKNGVFYCDVDSCKINNMNCLVSNAILFYNTVLPENIEFSKKTDIFLLNILFLNMLTNKKTHILNYKDFVKLIEKLDLDDNLKNYFKNIYDLDDHLYLADAIEKISEDEIRRLK